MPLPGQHSCGAGPVDKGASRRIHASVRRALIDCPGVKQRLALSDELKRMMFRIHLSAVDAYDPEDPTEFAAILTVAAEQYPGKRECAELFGVAHSTFYRWKLGEVIPHALVRGAVRERLLDRMTSSTAHADDAANVGALLRADGSLSVN